jgi:tripartite-type tricarboxylate transporter receptor subunit TctC
VKVEETLDTCFPISLDQEKGMLEKGGYRMFTRKIEPHRMAWTWVVMGLIAWLVLGVPRVATAQEYPNRPITIHVGFPPGALSGLVVQTSAEGLKKYLPKPQAVLVNYKPGASGAIAADYVLKQPADGYNLFSFPVDLCVKMAKDGPALHFNLEDFVHLGTSGSSPTCILVSKEGPYKTFDDFMAAAKKDPGKISYGTPGIASLIHLVGEVFQLRCGVKLNHIPFSGGGPAITAVLGGHVDCYLGSIAAAGSHVRPGGGLKILAVFARERDPDFPDVPTCFEKGYDVDQVTWHGLTVAKGTPQPVIDLLRRTFKKASEDPMVKEALTKVGYMPVNWTFDEVERKARQEYELAREIFKRVGLVQ